MNILTRIKRMWMIYSKFFYFKTISWCWHATTKRHISTGLFKTSSDIKWAKFKKIEEKIEKLSKTKE